MANEKQPQQISFSDYWKALKESDIMEFRQMKKEIMTICGLEEYNLRRKKRDNTFSRAEKIVITDIISERENTQFEIDVLFPSLIPA